MSGAPEKSLCLGCSSRGEGAAAGCVSSRAMASMTFDLQWKEAMVELLDQLELLDPDSSDSAKEALSTSEAGDQFQQYATLR